MALDWRAYGLLPKALPTQLTDPVSNWAGRDDVRVKLRDVVDSCLSSDTGLSEFVILSGSFGAGKSHALRYFASKINALETDHFGALALYVKTIKVGEKISFLSLYKGILTLIGTARLAEVAQRVSESVEVLAAALMKALPREELEKLPKPTEIRQRVIESLPEGDRAMVRLLLAWNSDEGDVQGFLQGANVRFPDLGWPDPIKTDHMAVKVITALIRCMTTPIGEQEALYGAVYLFLDEVETVMDGKSADAVAFFQSIRELINDLPTYFGLLMSFTGDTALVEAIIPEHTLERQSRASIDLQAMEPAEAKTFVSTQLAAFRPEDFDAPQPFHPFTEDAVEYILEQVQIMVPRKIFRKLRLVFERAIRREGLEPGQEIDAQLAEEIVISAGL